MFITDTHTRAHTQIRKSSKQIHSHGLLTALFSLLLILHIVHALQKDDNQQIPIHVL